MKKIFCIVVLLAVFAMTPDIIIGEQTSLSVSSIRLSAEKASDNPEPMLTYRVVPPLDNSIYSRYRPPYRPPHRPPYRPYRRGPHPHCFIATAAYGENHQNLNILRDFRDRWLLTNSAGSNIVEYYYQVGPAIAEFIHKHDYLRPLVRGLLKPLVGIAYVMNSLDNAGGIK